NFNKYNDIEDDFIDYFRSEYNKKPKEQQQVSFQVVQFIKEEPILADNLLGLISIHDNDHSANGELTLELQVYVQCTNRTKFTREIYHLL
ncbi:unnamed protein product, partial [Didymodactylos carnosus]